MLKPVVVVPSTANAVPPLIVHEPTIITFGVFAIVVGNEYHAYPYPNAPAYVVVYNP
jgi:hypothetical protein